MSHAGHMHVTCRSLDQNILQLSISTCVLLRNSVSVKPVRGREVLGSTEATTERALSNDKLLDVLKVTFIKLGML